MGANFHGTTDSGFTEAQLKSTASYQTRNLHGIDLQSNDLTGWDLRGQNLTDANLSQVTLTDVNLSNAYIAGGNFNNTYTPGLTQGPTAIHRQLPIQELATNLTDVPRFVRLGLQRTEPYRRRPFLHKPNQHGSDRSHCCGSRLLPQFAQDVQRAVNVHGQLPSEELARHWPSIQRPFRLGLQRPRSHRCRPVSHEAG